MRMLATTATSFIAALLLVGCASGSRHDNWGNRPPPTSPSDLVAAEIALNRLVQEKGQWTAFRETAALDAIMFTPTLVQAQSWLKGRANPAQNVRWQPHQIFISCDGTLGATTGAAQWPDGTQGYFTTIWQRNDKGRGEADILKRWTWVANSNGTLATPLETVESVETRIASCKGTPVAPQSAVPDSVTQYRTGKSADTTLEWYAGVTAEGQHRMFVNIWDGQSMISVIEEKKVQE